MRNALTALLVACSCSSSVLGQDELPTFYLFQGIHVNNQVQSQPLGFESDPRMTALVAVNTASGTVDDDPVNAADKVMDFIRDRLVDPTKGYLNPADIAVSLPGFAHGQPETGADLAPNSAMRDPSDPIRPPP